MKTVLNRAGFNKRSGTPPLDSELFISQTQAIELHEPFDDGRSIAAKRYRTAQQGTKPEMVKAMIKRALNVGIMADYHVADAWFGNKAMIRLTQETALVPVPRMKKNNMKHRLSDYVRGKTVTRELDVQALYKHCVRKAWQPISGQKYQANIVYVELNLAESKDPEEWVKVRLLFVRGNAGDTQTTAGKLWQVFRAVIAGALDELRAVLGDLVTLVMETIDTHIKCLFKQVLQLDLKTLRLEAL